MVGAGNLDSMEANYSVSGSRRKEDFYSPGKKAGLRPDRALIVYANRARGATTGAMVGAQPFGGWKGSGSTGLGSGTDMYLAQYMRQQSLTVAR